ncbi:MAG: ATP-binding protein, partial [Gammaproteobacteria bacterium]
LPATPCNSLQLPATPCNSPQLPATPRNSTLWQRSQSAATGYCWQRYPSDTTADRGEGRLYSGRSAVKPVRVEPSTRCIASFIRSFRGQYGLADESAPTGHLTGDLDNIMVVERRPPVDDLSAPQLTTIANDFFEMALDHVAVAGLDGYFKRINPAWSRTLGWSHEELMSRPSIEFVHPDDRDATLAGRGRLRDGKEMGPLVNRYLCKDGGYRWFEWRSVAEPEKGLVYAAARDVTAQKQAEAELQQAVEREQQLQRQLLFADRMASVGTLAAGVAHEINNPLAYVTGNLALLLEDLEALQDSLPPERRDDILAMAADAKEGAERIRKIVSGLRTFSRAEKEERKVVEVRPLLDVAVNMTINEIRHRARLHREDGPIPPVEADDARLGQVFINLLVNAAHAVGEESGSDQEVRIVTATDDEGRAVIAIEDTGPGIPEDVLPRIFDPFFTTKPVGLGTGLGLSICHNIVRSLGGSLTASNRPGRGASFRVVLPAAKVSADAARMGAEAGATASPSCQSSVPATCAEVLVVDDEPAIGVILRKVLKGHDVTAVTAARDALTLLEDGHRFDVILCDLMMPEMSGMDFHTELDRRFPDLARRVVFISGGAFTPAAHAYLDRVPNERLAKPFQVEQIRAVVRSYV